MSKDDSCVMIETLMYLMAEVSNKYIRDEGWNPDEHSRLKRQLQEIYDRTSQELSELKKGETGDDRDN
jgi:hypothetical protein